LSWENVPFEPTPGQAWLRFTLIPVSQRPTDVTATGLKRIDALFQVDVFAPADNGPAAAETLAEAVIAAYAPGDPLTSNGVSVQVEYAEVNTSAVYDPPWYAVSVTIKVKAFIA
jgi:hypothetical protein